MNGFLENIVISSSVPESYRKTLEETIGNFFGIIVSDKTVADCKFYIITDKDLETFKTDEFCYIYVTEHRPDISKINADIFCPFNDSRDFSNLEFLFVRCIDYHLGRLKISRTIRDGIYTTIECG